MKINNITKNNKDRYDIADGIFPYESDLRPWVNIPQFVKDREEYFAIYGRVITAIYSKLKDSDWTNGRNYDLFNQAVKNIHDTFTNPEMDIDDFEKITKKYVNLTFDPDIENEDDV